MKYACAAVFAVALLVPGAAGAAAAGGGAHAPVVRFGRSVVVATSSPANVYALGASVVLASSVKGDLTALGGTITDASPAAGDALFIGGSVTARAPVFGDLRIIAGSADVEKSVGGDLAVLAFSVRDAGRAEGALLVFAGTAQVTGGAEGPATIYGNSVTLGGEFEGDVRVIAGDHLTLLPGTVIRGTLVYEAPTSASIPASASIAGGVTYTESSYLPGAGVSKALIFASLGIFFLVRVLAALVLAGLLAGLFPELAGRLVDAAYERRTRRILLTTLLGFAGFVAVPILALLLSLTFIGLGLALLLFILYALLVLLSLAYAGILIGGLFSRRFLRRVGVRWTDGVLGMLALSLAALVPVLGLLFVLFLASFSAGALLHAFFRFAFMHEDEDTVL